MPQSRTPKSTHQTPSQQQKVSSNTADITQDSERGQPNEESLRDSQARLSGIVDSAMDVIITVDEKQRVLVFNRAAGMVLCPAKEALGSRLIRFIPKRFQR